MALSEKPITLKKASVKVKIAYFMLIALVIIWQGFLGAEHLEKRLVYLAIGLIPLLTLMVGVMQAKGKTAVWLTVISLLYLAHSLMMILDSKTRILAIIELLLASNLYWQAFAFGKLSGERKKKDKKKPSH